MHAGTSQTPYESLVALIDRILEDCEEDVECLVVRLDGLEQPVRDELLTSDLLNAWQVFYFCFRREPDILTVEHMELEPASALRGGLKIEETDLLEMYFVIHEGIPVIVIHDGDKAVAMFSGKTAYRQGRTFMENPEYQ